MEGSEPIKSGTQRTRRAALQAVKESNKVEDFQNAASPPCVLIIRRCLRRKHDSLVGRLNEIHNSLRELRDASIPSSLFAIHLA
jgi:hypothetical protein